MVTYPCKNSIQTVATTWKVIYDQAPKYIQQLIHKKPQVNHNLTGIVASCHCQNTSEDRAFSFVAPKLRNSLPDSVRNAITLDSFKKSLKTHLFQKFYKNYQTVLQCANE